jgi:hypothetical protein
MMTIQKKSLKVGKYVNTEHVDTLVRTYKQERWIQNSERIGKEDTKSVWYSVQELEEFIARIKDHGANGVRVYFGVYPKDFAVNPDYAGQQTLAFVGTKSKETELGRVDKEIYINTETGTSVLAYNFGSLCPTQCGRGDGSGGNPEIGITIIDRGDQGMTII